MRRAVVAILSAGIVVLAAAGVRSLLAGGPARRALDSEVAPTSDLTQPLRPAAEPEPPPSPPLTVLCCGQRAVAVRSDPDPSSEQVTQALYGQELRVSARRNGWLRIRVAEQSDYPGWFPAACAVALSPAATRTTLWCVATPDAVARAGAGVRAAAAGWPSRLAGGSMVRVIRQHGSYMEAVSLRGEPGWFRSDELIRADGPADPDPAASCVSHARGYLGTRYLWGGMTSDGIDCSGLVWAAHRAAGTPLARDARDQFRQGREIAREALRPGDCVFFRTNRSRPGPSHVGLYAGAGRIIHASGTRGVICESLDSDYLRLRYLGARRMVPR